MTSINVISVEQLHYTHLVAEYKELPRVFTLARKAQREVLGLRKKLPTAYTLGTGHVLFFYDKLKYCSDRYEQLTAEMRRRGYNPKPVPTEELLAEIDKKLYNNYVPTAEAVKENTARINLRLSESTKRKGK